MSDYRFGDDYKLSIYPKEAMGYGGLDMDKVESVEIEWVDFVRKPDDKSRWHELFGTPERAARTITRTQMATDLMGCCDADTCPAAFDECWKLDSCPMDDCDALLEWLRGE